MKAHPPASSASAARDLRRWLQARELAGRLERESFAASRRSPSDAFGAACGLMDLASRFQTASAGPDIVRQRDARDARDAWLRLRQRYARARR